MPALYKGLLTTSVISAVCFWVATQVLMGQNGIYPPMNLFLASLVGIVVTIGMVGITEFYTSTQFGPVAHLADASNTGHGTNIIAGLALSMKSTLAPVVLISAAILVSFTLAGIYGVAVAAMAMLSLTGIVVSSTRSDRLRITQEELQK